MSQSGKYYRNTISLFELTTLYPDEASAERWLSAWVKFGG